MNNDKVLPYIVLVILVAVFGLYQIYQVAMPTYELYNEVQTKTQNVANQEREIESIRAQREQQERDEQAKTKPVYKNELATLDPMSSFGVMFEDVIQAAKYNGLKLRSISYNTTPSEDIVYKNIGSEYNVCAITMQLIGNYSQFRSYFQDIYNYPYLINLDKISIKPYENNKKILISDITVSIYSTRNEAQKKAYESLKAAAELKSGTN